MLTVLHPEIYHQVLSFPIGMMAAPDPDGGSPFLIVKATKEVLLAAKLSGFFKVYVCPADLGGRETLALVFAFFDDEDEPFIISTPLVDDVESRQLLAALTSPSVNVHFFDEHGREFLVYEAEIDVPDVAKKHLDGLKLLGSDFVEAQNMLHGVGDWFGLRTPQDDEEALTVKLVHNSFGESLAIQDARYPLHQHHGAKGYSISMLEREEPGNFQEEDIIKCLAMCFPQSQIYHGPLRTTDKEEICDVLVVTDDRVLIIQAKDSPNVERIAKQKLSRKQTNAMTAFKKAVAQVRGAQSYIKAGNGTLRYILNGEEKSIDISQKQLFAITIIKEVFERESEEYAKILNVLMVERSIPCYVISYGMFYELCYRVRDPDKFFQFSEEIVESIKRLQDLPVIDFHG
ncbi:hypothetical protein NIPOLPBK_00958 [Stenotrophomonas maltophilia]|uniref:hypothetical protein n=1 Tax=Stenotrophomonas maltophilia TaxID=40324 RepID=UPI0012B14601|nr:hypothetical protein [Stenotrophomonas maltophilia]MCU1175579.1 hypothetical protein [Stenotrophomonas maltophilia]QGL72498.1 hypothetical protein FEO85_13945 [Stenotrophomonas maltophilia]QNG67786.1 hypothetical protein NIPOLPBK_00958 [Stenotrophomonas maltophilia]WBL68913.1 hypothetical protein SMAL454_27560 [Stenotrophomonas maltophilia]